MTILSHPVFSIKALSFSVPMLTIMDRIHCSSGWFCLHQIHYYQMKFSQLCYISSLIWNQKFSWFSDRYRYKINAARFEEFSIVLLLISHRTIILRITFVSQYVMKKTKQPEIANRNVELLGLSYQLFIFDSSDWKLVWNNVILFACFFFFAHTYSNWLQTSDKHINFLGIIFSPVSFNFDA